MTEGANTLTEKEKGALRLSVGGHDAKSTAIAAAEGWLAMLDAGDWRASWPRPRHPSGDPNTLEAWAAASERAARRLARFGHAPCLPMTA